MKRLGETLSGIIVKILLLLTVAAVFSFIWSAKSHNFYRDWEFTYYLEQFGLLKYADGNDVIETLGRPRDIAYSYYEADSEKRVAYITLIYDSFEFGILGRTLSDSVTCIFVKAPGVIRLRGGTDIGSNTGKADKAYKSERRMVDHYGFILGEKYEISDGGGTWIELETDENGRIYEISISDGI